MGLEGLNGREGILVLHGVESHIVLSTVICCGRVSSNIVVHGGISWYVVGYRGMWLSSKFEGPGRNILDWEAGRDLGGYRGM